MASDDENSEFTDGEEHSGVHAEEHDDHDEGGHGASHHGGDHEEGGHGEPWLVSYADLMTLLFGFFVLMYSFEAAKNSGDTSMVKMRRELAQFFGGGVVNNPLGQVAKNYQDRLNEITTKGDVKIAESPEGLEITFQSTALFASGSAELTESAHGVITPLIALLKSQGKDYGVRVEGYTDDNPIKNAVTKFPSNWELSSARASMVLRLFEVGGFDPNRLTAVGFGQTRPLVANRDPSGVAIPENQAQNRRVKIYITNSFDNAGEKVAAKEMPEVPAQPEATKKEEPSP